MARVEQQKWVACSLCSKWRQVPFNVSDSELGEDWTCSKNVWDPLRRRCSVPQTLSDAEIDQQLSLQGAPGLTPPQANGEAQFGPTPADQASDGLTALRAPPTGSLMLGMAADRSRAANASTPAAATPFDTNDLEEHADLDAANALLALVPPGEVAAGVASTQVPDPGLTYVPGTLVWAKVEGHEWWPALVIRRRAVPRNDVGPPPGGPTNVQKCFPVVFLNQMGIPSEIQDSMDTRQGALAACLRAHKGSAVSEELEAEYAWVQAPSLQPFEPGNYSLVGGNINKKSELATCVAAAERIMQSKESQPKRQSYDSDGGWGQAQRQAVEPNGQHAAATRRSRANRNRGGRRMRNRRAAGGDEADASVYSFQTPQIMVDSILGWRYPLSQSEVLRAQQVEKEAQAARLRELQALQHEHGQVAGSDIASSIQKRTEEAAEAALLLDFQSAAQHSTADGAGAKEREFLIKWAEHSHVRNEWVPEQRVLSLAKRKLLNFSKKYGDKPVDMSNPNWVIPERYVARRKCPYGPGWEILVKWTELGYENCTWESESDQVILDPRYLSLLTSFWHRQHSCLARSQQDARSQHERLLTGFKSRVAEAGPALNMKQPDYIDVAELLPHQLCGAAQLQRMYLQEKDAVLADEPAMGAAATTITFLQTVRRELKPTVPALLVVPNSSIAYWKGEVEYWLNDDPEVIFYTGPPGARQQIAQHEFWLQPGCLDGKVFRGVDKLSVRMPKPQVVVTSMENMLQDIEEIRAVEWDLIILDERHASRSFAHKMYAVLHDLKPRQRVSVRDASGELSQDQMVSLAAFLRPANIKDLQNALNGNDDAARTRALQRLQSMVLPATLRTSRADMPERHLPPIELQIPVVISMTQAESYRITLAKQYEQLGNHKAQRHSGQRASMLRSLCADICRICDHPYTLEPFEPEADSQRTIADYIQGSGKLHALQLLLDVLMFANKNTVVAAHASLSVLNDYLRLKYGAKQFHQVSEESTARERDRAVQDFNDRKKPQNLLLLEISSCSLGTDLHGADAVIVYDSDGQPSGDMLSLACARAMGRPRQLLVFRLYLAGTLEEVIVAGGSGASALAKALRPNTHRLSAADARLLEESLRFGVSALFAADADPPGASDGGCAAGATVSQVKTEGEARGAGGQAAQQDGAGDLAGSAAEQREDGARPGPPIAQEPPSLRPPTATMVSHQDLAAKVAALEELMQKLPPSLDTLPADIAQALQGAYLHDWRGLAAENTSHLRERSQDADEEDDNAESDEMEEWTDKMSVSMLASSSAAFWQRMLRQRWERLRQEEAEAAQPDNVAGGDDGDATSASEKDVAVRAPEEALPVSNSHSSHWGAARDADESESKPAVRTGRNARTRRPPKRRLEEDGDAATLAMPAAAPQAGTTSAAGAAAGPGGGGQAGPAARQQQQDAAAEGGAAAAPAMKRTRSGAAPPVASADVAAAPVATGAVAAGTSGAVAGASGASQGQPSQQTAMMLRSQFEAIMKALTVPGSLVNGIYKRARERLMNMAVEAELQLDIEQDKSVFEFALQAAQILLIMRPQSELPSDFQDYTLVALIGVAASLAGHQLGGEDGINRLAGMYKQTPVDLRSVYHHILGQISEYRTNTDVMKQMQIDVAFADPQGGQEAVAQAASGTASAQPVVGPGEAPPAAVAVVAAPPAPAQVDVFQAEIESILHMSTSAAAAQAGPLSEDTIADFNHRMSWVQGMAASPVAQGPGEKALVETVRSCAEMKRQMASLEMARKWRIDTVTQRYQQHMEKVRSFAQSIINSVNDQYRTEKQSLEANYQMLVNQMDTLASQSPLGPHLTTHLRSVQATPRPVTAAPAAAPAPAPAEPVDASTTRAQAAG